ncbi:uncharacterized protein PADG_11180 [Paracoccidioides brasiliensis Pb18]|uniref:Uncharacterized protein n=1 Tax=Paracoccidioides brasiliensis (strain Pb18) TaxID=502780 RepID=A0A0A0HW08_PARBD|nr:uncharacterized protein PADG_11180 [Paracoccidioides brasiliensis Pb18]KGM92722.1 hypothetical protein PADG_11180 [Paracoccidioides brasiliensis Pb18]
MFPQEFCTALPTAYLLVPSPVVGNAGNGDRLRSEHADTYAGEQASEHGKSPAIADSIAEIAYKNRDPRLSRPKLGYFESETGILYIQTDGEW